MIKLKIKNYNCNRLHNFFYIYYKILFQSELKHIYRLHKLLDYEYDTDNEVVWSS